MTGGSEATQTAKFVEMMDKFFDSLNVTSFERGKDKGSHSSSLTDPARTSA